MAVGRKQNPSTGGTAMPYLTAFIPQSVKPAAKAATPAAYYARCTAAGYLMQELTALLYREGNVPFDQILFPYADALLLSQHKPAYWGDCLCARIPQPLAERLPALLEEPFRPILPIRWEIAPSRGERPISMGLLEGEAHGYTLYTKEWADPLFTPDGALASAPGHALLLEFRCSGWDSQCVGPDWQVRRSARQFFSFCEVAARLAQKEGAVLTYAANGRFCLLAAEENQLRIQKMILNLTQTIPITGIFSVVIRQRFVI